MGFVAPVLIQIDSVDMWANFALQAHNNAGIPGVKGVTNPTGFRTEARGR